MFDCRVENKIIDVPVARTFRSSFFMRSTDEIDSTQNQVVAGVFTTLTHLLAHARPREFDVCLFAASEMLV